MIEEPESIKYYETEYYNKSYSLIAEVMFALIIDEYLSQIEKNYIIENTIIELPSNNLKSNYRIKIALESIGEAA